MTADQTGSEKAKVEGWLGDTCLGLIEITADRAKGQSEAFLFTVPTLSGSRPKISLYFKNDSYDGAGQDRNAYLLGATYEGVYYPGPFSMMSNGDRAEIFFPTPVVPAFEDEFISDDPSRWITFDGQNWPPAPGSSGAWARCYFYGWPTNSGGADQAARCLVSNLEAQCYEDRGVTITNDGLVLTATRDSNNHFGKPWTSGCVVQNRDLAMTFGYFEAEIDLPDVPGVNAAFWLLSADMQWPPEIDVVERVGIDSKNVRSSDAFHVGFAGGMGGNGWASGALNGTHRYGVLWTADTTEFFLDGVSVGAFPTPDGARKPMYMLLDLAVGEPGSWQGEPASGLQSVSMTVRRVRSWKLGSWTGTKLPSR